MNASFTPGSIKKFGRTSWRFQTTFETPLKDLENFVTAILSADDSIGQGIVTIDQIVFEPENLKPVLTDKTQSLTHDWSVTADTRIEVQKLLHATFADWIDFAFVPSPKKFVIYADHDEYATFYANTKSNLNRIVTALSGKSFTQVTNWQRQL
jgi:hypothetical protein